MRTSSKRGAVTLAASVFALLCAASCSSSSSDGPKPDKTAPTVTATPGSLTWTTGTQDVVLSATDNRDASPDIYYTTDATIPTAMSTPYVAGTPITLTDTTVLRAIAIDNKGNVGSLLEGYVFAPSGIAQEWAASGHGDIIGEPFRHWDEDGAVSASCARCHSGPGFVAYVDADMGNDGDAQPLPIGHYCDSCHTSPPTTRYDDLANHPGLDPLEFPSGAEASLWTQSNMCIACHQGRESGVSVDDAINGGPGPYNFINIHYYAAAASYFGGETNGGYQYAGMEYVGRNVFGSHPEEVKTCVGCHMRGADKDHTFLPQVADCTSCHAGTSFETLTGSPIANHTAITTLSGELLDEIQTYATGTVGTSIAYDPHSYPYWFKDNNNNGNADAGEVNYGNRYNLFDATLLKAAYNYQVIQKDPAGYIHNGVYLWQLLNDSIADLGGTPSLPAPGRTGFDRDNALKSHQWHLSGHADSAGEPFRHWDGDGDVSSSCARCHSTPGFVDYVADGTTDNPAPLGSLVECAACHQYENLFTNTDTRHDHLVDNPALEPVTFPSGATATFNNSSNICMTCHQGRESGVSVDAKTPNGEVQAPDYDSFDFVNRHYYAAAAILFGSDVTAAYEWAGQTYRTQNTFGIHLPEFKDCTGCHMRDAADHVFLPEVGDCSTCHLGLTDFEQLGVPFGNANVDYDGDGTGESFNDEIVGMAALAYAEMQDYARNRLNGGLNSSPIVYAPSSYPYWFKDTNDNGMLDAGEDDFGNRYRDFDRELLRAAFNYHSGQDPASDVHNFKYVLQTLYDTADIMNNGAFDGSFSGTAIRP